jgi:hypothetical protein
MQNESIIKPIGIFPLALKSWLMWLKQLPFSLKWFMWIILLKPILDAFYFVKDLGILSPSQLIGFISFIFFFIFIFSKKHHDKVSIQIIVLLCFSSLLIINACLVFLFDFDIKAFGEFIRIILPIFLFFYLRNEIKSLDDINGFLTTFLVSSIFPFLIYIYEYVFVPIQLIEISEGRGGGYRLTGIYADMFNYMSYIIGNFLILLVAITNAIHTNQKIIYKSFILVIILTILGLLGIKHQASWGVFFGLLLLFLMFNFSYNKGKKITFYLIFCSTLILPTIWKENITPLYSKEIKAYETNKNQDRALNGRIIRWKKYFNYWNNMSLESKLFGVGFSGHKAAPIMMSGGMHSDYIRFIFSSGLIGVLCYVSFYILVITQSFKLPGPVRFFTICTVMLFLLYGISSNPFGASGSLLYLGILGLVLVEKPRSFFIN